MTIGKELERITFDLKQQRDRIDKELDNTSTQGVATRELAEKIEELRRRIEASRSVAPETTATE